MAFLIYVDNSNVFIEAQRVSAVSKHMALNIYDAMNNRILDTTYRMDFGDLHYFLAGNDPTKIKRAMLFGSRPPKNDRLCGGCQDSCRLNRFHAACLTAPMMSDAILSGLR